MGGWLYWKSASIPGRQVQDMPIKYQGFEFHAPGPIKYDPNPWKVTFSTPGDFLVRNAMERWSFEIFNDETSCGRFSLPCPSSTIDIGLLDNKCRIVRQYRLVGVYPSNISNIEYGQDNLEVTNFSVDFTYQWWRPVPVSLEVLDDGTSPIVDGIFAGYSAQIATNQSDCSPIDALNALG
jgi:hypothetical protein